MEKEAIAEENALIGNCFKLSNMSRRLKSSEILKEMFELPADLHA